MLTTHHELTTRIELNISASPYWFAGIAASCFLNGHSVGIMSMLTGLSIRIRESVRFFKQLLDLPRDSKAEWK